MRREGSREGERRVGGCGGRGGGEVVVVQVAVSAAVWRSVIEGESLFAFTPVCGRHPLLPSTGGENTGARRGKSIQEGPATAFGAGAAAALPPLAAGAVSYK